MKKEKMAVEINAKDLNNPAEGIETPQKITIIPVAVIAAKEVLQNVQPVQADHRMELLSRLGNGIIPALSAFSTQSIISTDVDANTTTHIVICNSVLIDQIIMTVAALTATSQLSLAELEAKANALRPFINTEAVSSLFEGIEVIKFTDVSDYKNAFDGIFEVVKIGKQIAKATKIVSDYDVKQAAKVAN